MSVMKLPALMGAMAAALSLAACIIGTPTPQRTPTSTPAARPTAKAVPTAGVGGVNPTPRVITQEGRTIKQYGQPPVMVIEPRAKYTATIRTNKGQFTVELFAAQAPVTVNNFVFLAQDGFYDRVIFHRVIEGFMIQGGDPTGTGAGGPGYRFQDEIVPALVFDRSGILAMANAGPGTNGSQFFVTVAPTPHLNGAHTIFGRVTTGQEVVDAISVVPTGQGNRPLQPVVIQGIGITKTGG